MNKGIVIVSGSSSKLGVPIAEYLDKKGYKIYAGIRNPDKLLALRKRWEVSHPDIVPISLDVTKEASCKSAIEEIIKREKRLDVIINAAALISTTSGISTDIDFMDTLNTNAVGAYRLIKAALPSMVINHYGKIINISSLLATVSIPAMAFYCASKAAMEGMGTSLRYELAKDNVWITNLALGNMIDKRNPVKTADNKLGFIRKFILPDYDYSVIADKIDKIIRAGSPPSRAVIGWQAKVITSLEGLFRNNIEDFIFRQLLTFPH